jgi:hypothetical protein
LLPVVPLKSVFHPQNLLLTPNEIDLSVISEVMIGSNPSGYIEVTFLSLPGSRVNA